MDTPDTTPDSAEAQEFPCPDEGCQLMFSTTEEVSNHIAVGKHWLLGEASLRDTAILLYQKGLQGEALMLVEYSSGQESGVTVDEPTGNIHKGWALKKPTRHVKFSEKQKEFILKKFQFGEEPGNAKARARDVQSIMKCVGPST